MDGFTGLDIVKAKSDLINFNTSTKNITSVYADTVMNFFDDLAKKWGSPNAVIFCNDYVNRLRESVNNLSTQLMHVVNGAVSAAQTIARSNGSTFSVDIEEVYAGKVAEELSVMPVCSESVNGVTGMAVENVKIIRDTFVTKTNEVITSLGNLPKGIAFYSTDGSLLNTYNTGIDTQVDGIKKEIDSVIKSLNSYIDTEANNILLAKQQANDMMA